MIRENKSRIEIANTEIDIVRACELLGYEVQNYGAKQFCPFGEVNHADQGATRAMRVYPESNTAFCHAGCGFMTPARIWSLAKGVMEINAADLLLEAAGWKEPTVESRWEALTSPPPAVDPAALGEALKIACRRFSTDWEILQFDPAVSSALRQCLDLLPRVSTAEDATTWLEQTKIFMRRKLSEVDSTSEAGTR